MVDGSLIPPKTDAQLATLARLETILALVEGWVDVVTARATSRLPKADAIAEMVRRRSFGGVLPRGLTASINGSQSAQAASGKT